MKITLCGSIAFIDAMSALKTRLELMGHTVQMPPLQIENDQGHMIPVLEYYKKRKAASKDDRWIWDTKSRCTRDHFNKVVSGDAILVLNHEKNGIAGYVGPNTLLEMGVAFHFQKKIFLLNPIPEMHYTEEIIGLQPLILEGDLGQIV